MKKVTLHGLLIVILASLFYAYDYLLQATPGVITNQLLRDFHLDAVSLSVLAAFFFYAYAPTQLLGGILFDRFGPRILLSVMVAVCAFGALLFALGDDVWQLSAGRALMGLGSAFAFVGALLLTARWLPLKYFAFTAGLLQALGCIGAIMGQVPIAWLVQHYDWRSCFQVLFYLGMALAITYIVILRNWPKAIAEPERGEFGVTQPTLKHSLKQVFGNGQTYWIAIYSFAIWIPVTVFATLWGIPFVAAIYHISITEASTVAMMVWLGIAVGSPSFGIWSSIINRRCVPLSVSAILALVSSLVALYVSVPLWAMYWVMFIFGLGASGQSLIFAVVQDNNPASMSGTAMGFNNLAVVAGGAVCQPLAGYLLHIHWAGTLQQGMPVYTLQDFQYALLLLPISAAVALLMSSALIRETYCKGIN
jgi:MFS family permease